MTSQRQGMITMRVAILDDFHHWAAEFADWNAVDGCEFTFFADHLTERSDLVQRLAPFDAIGLMRERTPMTAELINQLPNLKYLVTTGMANASIDLDACRARQIQVSGTESPGHATAELAFLMILSLFRRFVPLIDGHRQGAWQTELGQDARGKTLGIVGLGRLGSQLATLGHAIGMNVIAWSPNLTPERCAPHRVTWVDRDTLFRQADVVSIHMKLSNTTRHLIGRDALRALGPNGYLVNTSRAELIDPMALLSALDDGVIRGLATDVYTTEPTEPLDRLANHPRALCTPHIGYCTEETFALFYPQMCEAFAAFRDGKAIRLLT